MPAPILKYYGAKWAAATWITEILASVQQPRYVEPYCGSAAIACNLLWAPQHLVLNDLNGEIVNLLRVLRDDDQRERLIDQLELTPWARAEWEASFDLTTTDPTEQARRFLVRQWQSYGSTPDVRSASNWRHRGANGRAETVRIWRQLPARIQAVAAILRQAEIECLPALTIIGRYATPDTLIYCDPPYLPSVRNPRQIGAYTHEMTEADHAELLAALRAHPGVAAISHYDHPLYNEALCDWTRSERDVQAEGGRVRREVLWINRAGARQEVLL